MKERCSGFEFRDCKLIAAGFLPLHQDGSLNLGMIPRMVEHLIREGISGLFVNGTTGEWASLTTSERVDVSQAWIEAVQGRLPVIVHVGSNSVKTAQELARSAQEMGAAAISAISPFYFKPKDGGALVAACAEVAAGAPDLPFFYYHIPALTGVRLRVDELLPGFLETIPNFAGLKFSDSDLYSFRAALNRGEGRCEFMFGIDEMLQAAVSAGAQSAVGSTYNFAAPLYLRMWDAQDRGELSQARALQSRAVEMARLCEMAGGLSAFKAVMGMIGLDCGPLRRPNETLSAPQVDALRRKLEEIGFFDWARS